MTKTKAQKIKIETLVLDYNIYPRTEVDSVVVTDLVSAMEAGVVLPPILVDEESNKVVDGFHRVTGYKRAKIDEIEVIYKTYESDADLYLDAVACNAKHGRKLSRYDQIRIITQAEVLQISPEVIATALNITVERAEGLKIKKTAAVGKKIVPIKQTLWHLAGRKITQKQVDGNTRAGGMNPLFYINQVINLIENDLIDWENIKVVDALMRLGEMINLRDVVNK